MRRTFVRDTSYVQEMIILHQQGWSSVDLGKKFNKDHTTILHHLRRNGIPVTHQRPTYQPTEEELEPTPFLIVTLSPNALKYAHLFMEKINKGKTYAEYRKEAMQRKTERDYFAKVGHIYDSRRLGEVKIRAKECGIGPSDFEF